MRAGAAPACARARSRRRADAWVEAVARARGTAYSVRRPAGSCRRAPRIVSTITAASAPSSGQRSIGSPCSSPTSTRRAACRVRSRRATGTPAPWSERSSLPTRSRDGRPDSHRRRSARGSASRRRCTGSGCGSLARSAASARRRADRRGARRRRAGPPRSRAGSARSAGRSRVDDGAVVVDLIAVVQQAARRLGGAVADGPPRDDLDRRGVRLVVGGDDRERLIDAGRARRRGRRCSGTGCGRWAETGAGPRRARAGGARPTRG